MTTVNFRKGLVLAVICLFLFTGLSSVYGGSIFNEMETLEDDNVETMETALDKIRTLTDRESLLKRFDTSKKLLRNLYNRIRKPTIIDGEEWDIVVPDNYSTIQDAVNAAGPENGYRIFVRAGTYVENIVIGTDGIVLHGESNDDTVIDGSNKGDTISIDCNYLNVSGFTVKNSGNNHSGIKLFGASGNRIQDNNIISNSNGVSIVDHSHANNITGNTITTNIQHGVLIRDICSGNVIHDNIIVDNREHGISIDNVSRGNLITWNTINENNIGINCTGTSDGNLFHHNSIIENNLNAFDTSDNSWDDGEEGNYWSDYTGVDSDSDGIGDTPYSISGGDNQDRFPLMDQPQYYLNFARRTEVNKNNDIEDYESIKPQSPTNFMGDTIVVPDDYTTIQEAVNHSDDGDRIEVRPGTYFEHVIVDKQLEIMGDGSDVTFVNGSGLDDHVFTLNSDYVDISGLTIQSCSVGFSGVRVYGNSCNIHDNILRYCGGGVELWAIKDAIIQNNIMKDNAWGIYVHISRNCQINDNVLVDNLYGLELGISTINISRNIVKNNSLQGILQIWSNQVVIQNNSISSNGDIGLQMFSSNYNIVISNVVGNNSGDGISLYKSINNVIQDNIVSNNGGVGVSFRFYSSGNTITGNNITDNNQVGIFLRDSSGNTITGNNITDNNDYGIELYDSSGNTITGNNIDKNSWGIELYDSSGNTITGNNITDNNSWGIELYDSSGNTITGNNITDNNKVGIWLWYSSGNTITGNNIDNNGDGIRLWFSSGNNIITGNNITDNNFEGIWLYDSSGNTITGNNITDNNWNGIRLSDSSCNIIKDNVFQSNGITISGDNREHWNSHIIENNIANGDKIRYYKNTNNVNVPSDTSQVILANCRHFTIQNLNLSHTDTGVQLGFSSGNTITGNNITDNNQVGIFLRDSSGNTITGNNIDNNNHGITPYDSNSNTIKKNNFIDNKNNQANYENSHFNFWFHNYWNDWPRTIPRPIYGTIYLERFDKEISWVNFDWHPAREPYDIGG